MSQIKFAPFGCGHDGTVEAEQEQRKLEEKAHFLCITVSFLGVYSGVTPTPLSLFNFLFFAPPLLPVSLTLPLFLLTLPNLKVFLLLLPLLTQSDLVY